MSRPHRLTAFLRRACASRRTPAVVAALLLVVLAVWATRLRLEQLATDTGAGRAHLVLSWDTSRWQALAAFWWQALALSLALAAVLSVVWGGRGWLSRRAPVARFFVASLLVHCLLLL